MICLIDRIVHEIHIALSHELYLSALALALTLPDTCGKAEYPNEDYNGVRYKNWCSQYVITDRCDSPYGYDMPYCDFPYEHWTRIRTNNVIERLNREIRRRTRVVGTFPDGNSALMLVCARLRHVAGTQWGNKKYMNMKHLEAALEDVSIAG